MEWVLEREPALEQERVVELAQEWEWDLWQERAQVPGRERVRAPEWEEQGVLDRWQEDWWLRGRVGRGRCR